MHTIPATEVKRRGVVALEEALKKGPVHIIKNNQPTCVVLSEEDYIRLTQQNISRQSLNDLLANRPWKGTQNKKDIKNRIENERNSWDE